MTTLKWLIIFETRISKFSKLKKRGLNRNINILITIILIVKLKGMFIYKELMDMILDCDYFSVLRF